MRPARREEGALADIRAELDALEARHPGLKATISIERGPSLACPHSRWPGSPIVKTINAAYLGSAARRSRPGRSRRPATTAPMPRHLYAAGMAGIVCGPGGRYNTMPDERVDIADYLDMVRIYILTILRICE